MHTTSLTASSVTDTKPKADHSSSSNTKTVGKSSDTELTADTSPATAAPPSSTTETKEAENGGLETEEGGLGAWEEVAQPQPTFSLGMLGDTLGDDAAQSTQNADPCPASACYDPFAASASQLTAGQSLADFHVSRFARALRCGKFAAELCLCPLTCTLMKRCACTHAQAATHSYTSKDRVLIHILLSHICTHICTHTQPHTGTAHTLIAQVAQSQQQHWQVRVKYALPLLCLTYHLAM